MAGWHRILWEEIARLQADQTVIFGDPPAGDERVLLTPEQVRRSVMMAPTYVCSHSLQDEHMDLDALPNVPLIGGFLLRKGKEYECSSKYLVPMWLRFGGRWVFHSHQLGFMVATIIRDCGTAAPEKHSMRTTPLWQVRRVSRSCYAVTVVPQPGKSMETSR